LTACRIDEDQSGWQVPEGTDQGRLHPQHDPFIYRQNNLEILIYNWIIKGHTQFSDFVVQFGYKSNLFAAAESGGFAVLIFLLLIFIKKIADTTCSGPPIILFLRYLGIS
jgi:hypothetical protein